MSIQLILPEGRLVCGHPINRSAVTDNANQPVKDAVGQPVTKTYFALAIPKAGSTDWKQTEWGAQIAAQAAADWPNGEHGAPTFSWKIHDGDSTIPNKNGKKPAEREGWPGCWVIHCETRFIVKCFPVGCYDETNDLIRDAAAIKTGDYGRAFIDVKGNNPSQTPGVYINPQLFEHTREGAPIVSNDGPSAASVFGGAPAAQPMAAAPAAQPMAAAPAPQPTAPVAPAPDLLQPKKYNVNGAEYTHEQLVGFGWTEEQIAASATPV